MADNGEAKSNEGESTAVGDPQPEQPVEPMEVDAGSTRKRTATERQEAEEVAPDGVAVLPQNVPQEQHAEEVAKKRQRTSRRSKPPPKKLNNEQWDAMFEKLVEYKKQHGDCLVPKRYAADPKLGTWVETQRVQHKRLMSGSATPNKRLNAARLERLESIGFAWSAKNVRKPKQAPGSTKKKAASTNMDSASRNSSRHRLNEVQWNDMYDRLVQYRENHGDCLVPKRFEEDPKLATWVETQRVLYNRDYKKGSDIHTPTEAAEAAVAQAAVAAVEGKTPEEWASELEKGTTDDDVAEVVAATMEAATMEVVDQVTAATEAEAPEAALDREVAEGAASAPPDTAGTGVDAPDECQGGGSAVSGKPAKRLTEDRKKKLDDLGFVWSLRSKRVDDHWDEMFEKLLAYKEQHGDCLVPSRFSEDFKLGKWVETQRYEYTKLLRKALETANKGEEKSDDASSENTPKASRPTNQRLTEERLRRLESVGFEWKVKNKMKRYYDRQWDAMYDRLLEFRKEHGHCMVPKRYPPDMKLGTWVHTQRIQFRKKHSKKETASESADGANDDAKGDEETSFRLTEDRRKRLEEAGFVWSARESEKSNEPATITRNSYDDQWDAMLERLVKYKEKHGDCNVPKRCKEDQKLGTWIDTQRVQYKKMKKQLAKMGIEYKGPAPKAPEGGGSEGDAPPSTAPKPIVGRLTDDRIRRLEALGFVWSLRDDWQSHYKELIEYKREHGHCNVPARYQKNRRLGIWVSAQRQQMKIMNASADKKKQRSSTLTMERVGLLDELGFTWTIRSRDSLGESWNQRLSELRAYKEKHGNCLVPSRFTENPELGVWVGTQRTQYRLYQSAKQRDPSLTQSSAMSDDRIRQLEELGFVWALRGGSDSLWRRRVSELVEYKSTHGDLQVPKNYKGNMRLGYWIDAQRAEYQLTKEGKPSKLDPEKIAELDTIGFVWEPPQQVVPVAGADEATATASALAAAASAATGEPMQLDVPAAAGASNGTENTGRVAAASSAEEADNAVPRTDTDGVDVIVI